MAPKTRYARSGDVSIAYQVVGDGPRDLLWVPGWVSHVEAAWEEPALARFFDRLASFSRLILFDKRGTGMSDRVPDSALPTLEQRMDDVRAVLDATGSASAALFGMSEGVPMCVLFGGTYPSRTTALVLYGGYARRMSAPDYPWGISEEASEAFLDEIARDWGGPVGLAARAPSVADDTRFRETWARYLRMGASPAAVLTLTRMNAEIDVRPALAAVGVPTLVIHRTGDRALQVGGSRWMAEQIPGARFAELPGEDHLPWVGDQEAILEEIEEFLTGARPVREPDRVLATVLFTDIVGSTERAVKMGDRQWMDALEAHRTVVRWFLERFRGREIDTAGDGFFATFDGPARAIRCALAVRDAAREHGLEIRAGVHTGEVDMAAGEPGGIAVHIGARVASQAADGEVLVSSTVKDLVAGSGISFLDRGAHTLKGVPGIWQLWAVQDAPRR